MSHAALDIRDAIHAKLASGELSRATPDTVWAGKGTDRPCAACGARIAAAHLEYEAELPAGPLFFHHSCLMIWDEERVAKQQRNKDGTVA